MHTWTGRMAAMLVTSALALGGTATATLAIDEETGPLRIGLEAPLSGDLAVLGDGMLKGAQLAAAQINDQGGLVGRDVEIVPIDDAGDADTGAGAAHAAIAAGLDGVVGPYNSGVGIQTLPIYIEAGLVPIRLTSDDSTNGLGYTLQPMTYQIAPVAATALTDWFEATSVAIVYDDTQNYTTTIAESLRALLEEAGVEVVAYETVEPGLNDYAELVSRVVALEPDVVYADVYVPEGGRIAKALFEAGVTSGCLADYASYDTSFVEIAGLEAAQACPVVGVPAPDDFMAAEAWIAAYQEKFGEAPGTWSPYTFDSVLFLAAGITAAQGTEPAGLKAALDELDGWTGWTGAVSIDPATGSREPATVVVTRTDALGQLHIDADWAAAVDAPY